MKWLLWLYPAAWRRRYGDEFLALIEDRQPSPGVILDVLRAALDARLHPELGATRASVSASAAPPPRARLAMEPFDRFTRRSRNVLRLAQEEAERLQHGWIGTEHLLVGLLLERDGVAGRVLTDLGVDPDEVRLEIKTRLAQAPLAEPTPLGLTPGARRAIELSVGEARRLRHSFLGTEHLLLGLASGDGLGAEILHQRGVANVDELRQRIIRTVNDGPRRNVG